MLVWSKEREPETKRSVMRNRVEAYFGMLEQLSAEELDRSATEVAVLEKRNVARLIAHICEISRRNVHLECGYKNLFDYGVRRLNLSEGSVWRRLQVAKVCRRSHRFSSPFHEIG